MRRMISFPTQIFATASIRLAEIFGDFTGFEVLARFATLFALVVRAQQSVQRVFMCVWVIHCNFGLKIWHTVADLS